MKKLTLFLLTLIISCSAWGATKTIYCKNAQGWWKADDAAVAAYAWGNGTNASWPGVRMTKVDGESDLWSIELDTKYTSIIFTRVNGSGSIADWGAKTKDLTIPTDGKNLYTISSSSAVWGDPGVEGSWSTYTPPTVSFKNLQDTYYVGETYTFAETHAGLGNGAVTITYSVSYNGGDSQQTSGTYTFEKAGSYTFTVKAIGSKTAKASKTVTVLEAKSVSFNNIENIYYIGETYIFSATAHGLTDPITYTYTVNNNPITEASYTFNELGEYTIKVTATATNGTATATHTVNVVEPTIIYFKPNSNWTTDNAIFAVNFAEERVNLTDENTDGIYECVLPKEATAETKFVFHRINPNDPEISWNQTNELTYDGSDKNIYVIADGEWNNCLGYWMNANGDYTLDTSSNLYVRGNFNEWGTTDKIEFDIHAGENGRFSFSTKLDKGPYEFKIATESWSNEMNSDNIGEGDIILSGAGNIKFTLDERSAITFSILNGTVCLDYTKQTIDNQTNLDYAKYGKLTYQLPMPDNQWYWISLPFDVNVAEITVDGATNGKTSSAALVITEYNATKRANGENGWTETTSTTLSANKGYVMGPTDGAYNANMVVNFPSAATTNNVNSSANKTLTDTGGDAQNANWYIIGTGLYHQGSLSNINYVAMPAKNDKGEDPYEYKYISSGNELFTKKIGANSFDPFTAFFVQYGGEYSATAETTKSAALAPVARAKAQEQEQIYLINMNEAHTVVILNAEGSEGYTAGEDFLEMNIGSRIEMIYSFDGTDALAFNHRALEAQTIALGGYVATAGEQTISLNGYNANVESVTLIDNTTGETADLLAGNYTFTAEVGSLDGRFTVVFGTQKAGNTTVDCYNSTANQLISYGSANACTVSGLTTGEAVVVYNAMGQLVFATIADSETITLPTLPTGNYLILHNGTTNKTLLK